jgi:hypothetical protein
LKPLNLEVPARKEDEQRKRMVRMMIGHDEVCFAGVRSSPEGLPVFRNP